MEILTTKKNVIWDASTFSSFQACALKHNLRYEQNLELSTGKGRSFEMGSIAHKIKEVYYQNIIKGQKRDVAIACGMTAGLEFSQDYTQVRNSTEEEKQIVFDTMEQYFEFYRNDPWTVLEVEVTKGKVIYQDDDMRILWKAKLDCVIDMPLGIHPMDHKTFSQRRDETSLNNQFIGQCTIMNTRRVFVNRIGFQKTLKPNEKFTRHPTTFTTDRMLEWAEEIVPFYTRLYLAYKESGYNPPCWSSCDTKYGKCDYVPICEADRGARETEIKRLYVVGKKWDILNET